MPTPTLYLICGKIASGKSTLTKQLGKRDSTVVISEDDWLHALYSDQLSSLPDYVRCTANLRRVMGPHVVALLNSGLSVVLDFAANTVAARRWMKGIVKQSDAAHELHYLDVPDDICLARLHARNTAGDHPFMVTDEQFHQFSQHFVPPGEDEGFNVVVHTARDIGR